MKQCNVAILFLVWAGSKFKPDQGWSLISSRSDREEGPNWIDKNTIVGQDHWLGDSGEQKKN